MGVLQTLGCSKTTILESYQESGREIQMASIQNKIRQFFSSEDCDLNELSTKEWLKKRFYIKTKQTLSLKIDKQEQAYIDNFFMDKQISLLPELDHYVISSLSKEDLDREIAKRKDLKTKLIAASQTIYIKLDYCWKIDYPELFVKSIQSDTNSQDSGIESDEEDEHHGSCMDKYFYNAINNQLIVENQLNDAQKETLRHIMINLNRAILKPRKTKFFSKIDYHTPLRIQVEIANQQIALENRLSNIQLNKFIEILLQDRNRKIFIEKLNFRSDYARKIRILNGLIDRIKSYKEVLIQQQWLLQSMLDLQKKSGNQPGESYLPLRCRELSLGANSFQSSLDLSATAQGGAFYKQNEITSPVCYEQDLGHEKKIWSITREKDTLEYRNKKSSWFSAMVSLEVARAQVLDVMNRFTDPVVTVSLNNCDKKSEYNYRLVISAYNLTHPDSENFVFFE